MDLINEILQGIEKSELSDTNYGIIKSENNDILQKIHHNNIKAALKKLNEYRFCDDEVSQMKASAGVHRRTHWYLLSTTLRQANARIYVCL